MGLLLLMAVREAGIAEAVLSTHLLKMGSQTTNDCP
jgi:hypothetical protein